jgi:long-chain fatty acid transport protein
MKNNQLNVWSRCTLTGLLILSSGGAFAAGMGLWEWDVPGVATVSAGSAASGLSAASETANPAQAVLFNHKTINTGMVYLPVDVKMTATDSFNGSTSSITNAHSKSQNFIPDFHYIQPMKRNLYFSFGVTAPDGLNTDWKASDWVKGEQYNIPTYSSVKIIDVNPSMSYKVNSHLAFGVGVNALFGQADYNSSLSVIGVPLSLTNKLKGTAYDWNAGVLYSPRPGTRIGLSYRSPYTLHAKGPSSLTGEGGAPVAMPTTATADMKFPSKIFLSLDQKVNSKWDLLASIYHTNWSQLQTLTIHNIPNMGGSTSVPVDLHYRNTNLYSVGALYRYSPKLKLLAGVGYDMTPVENGYRDPRLPDSNRIDVGLGASYQMDSKSQLDVSFQHVFSKQVKIDDSSRKPADPGTIIGDSKTNANIFAVAYSRDID